MDLDDRPERAFKVLPLKKCFRVFRASAVIMRTPEWAAGEAGLNAAVPGTSQVILAQALAMPGAFLTRRVFTVRLPISLSAAPSRGAGRREWPMYKDCTG